MAFVLPRLATFGSSSLLAVRAFRIGSLSKSTCIRHRLPVERISSYVYRRHSATMLDSTPTQAPVTASDIDMPASPPKPAVKYLKDYTPPDYTISHTRLEFNIDDDGLDTRVHATLTITARDSSKPAQPLVLDGQSLELIPDSLKVSGNVLPESAFEHDSGNDSLIIAADALPAPGETFELQSVVRIRPAKNTALEGLYMTAGDFCTQCEAEGFRRMTFYLDRPDVMSKFNVRVEADKTKYPVLLSNGNCLSRGEGKDGRHWAEFEDPLPKPCYLFALVAGDFACLRDSFTTMKGRNVALGVYVKGESELRKCEHAMKSLKQAMKWDEDVYGLEYAYDVFNIVAVPSFVYGAMENQTLNIFNSKYILCSQETATDADYNNVQGVVAHEYFHYRSGNRVTLNSWFQLSLKEGLTVMRDQSFSMDMTSAAVKRIADVVVLRAAQFAEDAGPMAHPIRPKSYISCNNFYTSTVYNKGAEVVRMLKTIVGSEGFRRGTDIYFTRNDGKAVTCEDWVQAIEDGNPQVDPAVFEQFRRWYSTAGTPVVSVEVVPDTANGTMSLKCSQQIPPVAQQSTAEPLVIPLRIGLISPDGSPVPVDVGDGSPAEGSRVLLLRGREQTFVLQNVPNGSVPSLLREFSAPVKLKRIDDVSEEELAFLMANDADEFNRWESGQKLILDYVLRCIESPGDFGSLSSVVIGAFRETLCNDKVDNALKGAVFTPPVETYIIEQIEDTDPVRVRAALKHFQMELGKALETELKDVLKTCMEESGEFKIDPESQGKRVLKNVALRYLMALGKDETSALCLDIVRSSSNMTDVRAALVYLASSSTNERDTAFGEFYDKWKDDYLVVQKWLQIQATAARDDVLENVKSLTQHPSYDQTVPNCVYALIAGYAAWNVHMPSDGSGYKFLADQVIALDKINAQVASRVSKAFTKIGRFEPNRRSQMKSELERIKAVDSLSKDVYEVVNSCLKSVLYQ